MSDEQTTEYRIETLEKNVSTLDEKLDLVLTNHLPHLQTGVELINSRVGIILWVGGIIGSATILAVIGALYKLILK